MLIRHPAGAVGNISSAMRPAPLSHALEERPPGLVYRLMRGGQVHSWAIRTVGWPKSATRRPVVCPFCELFKNGQTLGLTNLRFTQPTSSRKHKTGTYGALCKPKVCKPKVCKPKVCKQNMSLGGQTTGWRVDGSRRHSVGAGPRRYPGSTPGPGPNQCTRRGPRLTLSAQARGPGVGGHKQKTRKP